MCFWFVAVVYTSISRRHFRQNRAGSDDSVRALAAKDEEKKSLFIFSVLTSSSGVGFFSCKNWNLRHPTISLYTVVYKYLLYRLLGRVVYTGRAM